MLFESSSQRQSASTSQTPTHTTPQDPSPPPAHTHHSKWTEGLYDLFQRGWIGHPGHSPGVENTASHSDGFDEKGYLSTSTENEARRDVSSWRRERKKRRRKAEIYVSFLYLPDLST